MKEQFNNWLTDKMKISGVLACGIRGPDRKTLTRSSSAQYNPIALEQACRTLADTFQILHANRFPAGFIRWVYENYFVYGSIRQDGHCLAVITRRNGQELQPSDLDAMLSEFHNLPV